MSILSLSHTDLDGISCQIVLRHTFGEITRMNIAYNKIDEYIYILEDYCTNNKPNKVFVTDLSFTFQQLKNLHQVTLKFPEITFYFIDHHPFKEDFNSLRTANFHILLSVKASATKLTYLFAKSNFGLKETDELKKYVEYVNAYDIWLEDTPEFKVGFVYNEIFWQYKIKHYWSKFKDNFALRTCDKELYKNEMFKKKKLFDKLDKNGRIFKLGDKDIFMIFVDDFRSHVTIDFPGYKVYVIAASFGGISIRTRKDIVDAETFKENVVSQVLELDNVLNAGGHPNAFGCSLEDPEPRKQIDFAKSLLTILDSELDKQKG